MRILWVKAGKLLPVDTGGKIRSYNLLRQLDKERDLTFLSYYGGPRDRDYERALADEFARAIPFSTSLPSSPIAEAFDYGLNLLSPSPYAVSKFSNRSVRGQIASLLAEDRFDVAICDFLAASLNFPRQLKVPTVLFQHNVETSLWRRQAEYEANPLKRAAFFLEAAKMSRYERQAVNRFHHVIAVSDADRRLMCRMTESSRISVVPTGVDLDQYQCAGDTHAEPNLVVFTGSMDWEANVDGVEYFCHEVWPLVLSKVPEARFRIVGRNPHKRVTALTSESIEVTGSVPAVVEHLSAASVVVVPLRIGGGTRLKIFEAMAMGKAVISSSVGAEGLDINPGVDILLEDEPGGFAESLTRLLLNRTERRSLGEEAARQASQFSWPVISARFEKVLSGVIAEFKQSPLAELLPISSNFAGN
jgi:glycosyltransferase involved in cell wall biosynthesis